MKTLSAKAQATREKILRAANDLFYLHGYNATGLDRIIAAAGVTKGNFYHHFKSKEELATAVIEWHRERAVAEIGIAELLASDAPRQAVIRLLEGMAERMLCGTDVCEVRGCFFGNFALELSTGSEAVRKKVQEVFDGMRSVFRQLLESAREAGEIRTDLDPERAAGMILSLMEGAVLLDKTGQTRREVRRAVEFIDDYLGP